MDYQIRKAVSADKTKIYELFTSSVRPYVEPIWGWDEAYQANGFDDSFQRINHFGVIEANNEFAGFVQISEQANIIQLCEIHLSPTIRGNGIGSAIIKELIRKADTDGCIVRTGCFKANTKAKQLYERLGFKTIQETETHYLLEYELVGR